MSTMKEPEMSNKTTQQPPAKAVEKARGEQRSQERRVTPEEVRRLIERHRETFDELAK
jgi:hypothetical protein